MSPALAIHSKAAELGKHVVRMTSLAGAGHPSSALSLAHLVAHLLYREMRHDPARPTDPHGDRLVLSEGHAVPIVYAAWADLGGAVGTGPRGDGSLRPLTVAELDQLRARDSVLDGHPNPAEGFPFFDAATGSLGQGLSVAAGLAAAARLDGSPRRVFALVGDGESREGQIWEAADFIVDYGLTNVVAVFNCNRQGQAGDVSAQQHAPRLAEKLRAFGWSVKEIDGHDPDAIADALRGGAQERPLAIVARTVKGWGVESLRAGNWHGKPLPASELPVAYASLDRSVPAGGDPAALPRPAPPPRAAVPLRVDPRRAEWPGFSEMMSRAGLEAAVQRRLLSTRRAYGAALRAAGEVVPQVVCLDGDVSNSTFTEIFARAHPARFFECKIAEQNMLSVAAGMAAAGLIPFANSFAKFIARALDQVELASISRSNIKIVGSHSGVTPCSDGPSQMGLLDAPFFRALTTVRGDDRASPLCWYFQPADAVAAAACTRLMVELRGMCYMRTHRPDVPLLYPEGASFEPGGFNVLRPGDDLAIIASGTMVHVALETAQLLARQNVRAAVIDAYGLPLATERLVAALRSCGRRALVVEDNYGGGLGAAVCEAAAAGGGIRVRTAHCDRVPKSTREPAEELEYCGLSAAQTADRVRALLGE